MVEYKTSWCFYYLERYSMYSAPALWQSLLTTCTFCNCVSSRRNGHKGTQACVYQLLAFVKFSHNLLRLSAVLTCIIVMDVNESRSRRVLDIFLEYEHAACTWTAEQLMLVTHTASQTLPLALRFHLMLSVTLVLVIHLVWSSMLCNSVSTCRLCCYCKTVFIGLISALWLSPKWLALSAVDNWEVYCYPHSPLVMASVVVRSLPNALEISTRSREIVALIEKFYSCKLTSLIIVVTCVTFNN